MGTVHAKAAGMGEGGLGNTRGDRAGAGPGGGGGLFDYDDTVDVDDSPILSKPTIRLNGVRARVDRVHVEGLVRTCDDVVRSAVQPLFQADDFEDVIVRAHRVRRALADLGCFKHVAVHIDVSGGPAATPEGLEVTFRVAELSRVVGGVNTMVGENEGSLVLGLKLPNVFGRGERLAAEYSLGHRSSSNFSVVAAKPLPLRVLAPLLSGTVYQQTHEAPWSGYRCVERGLLLEAAFRTGALTDHRLQWEGQVRELAVLGKAAAFPVRAAAGPQLKSLVRHIVTIDARDEPVFPTKGHIVKFTSEVCGLGGGVAHLRTDLLASWCVSLGAGGRCTAVATGTCGALHDVCGSAVPDRVFAGGPCSVRGFAVRGVGPHAERCALGATGHWAAGVSLLGPLPGLAAGGPVAGLLRAHLFLNAGWAGDAWALAARDVRVALGAGVALRLPQGARLELNYVVPLRALAEDVLAPGIQFGVGAHFL